MLDDVQTRLLESGIKKLNLEYNEKQFLQLVTYCELLVKWNKIYNLTTITDIEEIIVLHLLDGLSIVQYLADCPTVLDVGSGMGVPGIVVAIMLPTKMVTLIDSSSKKCAFLRQVKIELGLNNLDVVECRIECYVTEKLFSAIIARAFSNLTNLIKFTARLLDHNGFYLAMKSRNFVNEINENSIWNHQIINLEVPHLLAQRYLIKMTKS